MDTSLSMAVEDIPSSTQDGASLSRLARAQSILHDGVSHIPGEHAIVSYARDAILESPFTDEKNHLSHIIDSLRVREYFGGSDIAAPLTLAKMLYGGGGASIHVIWLLDGGVMPTEPLDIPDAWDVTIIGVGSDIGGKIPLGYTLTGERRYRTYSGSEVIVRYERDTLDTLGESLDARVIHLMTSPLSLVDIDARESSSPGGYLLLACASVFLIFAYFYHPYVRTR